MLCKASILLFFLGYAAAATAAEQERETKAKL
jgi:hypothetical protein